MNKVLWQSLAHSPWDHAKEDNFWQQLRENALYLKIEYQLTYQKKAVSQYDKKIILRDSLFLNISLFNFLLNFSNFIYKFIFNWVIRQRVHVIFSII